MTLLTYLIALTVLLDAARLLAVAALSVLLSGHLHLEGLQLQALTRNEPAQVL